jgi:hypothetical protein
MSILTDAIEAELHRETYVALLNRLLRKPGNKRELARRAKITPNYLSYILKLDRDPYSIPITRTPSSKVAQRIAQAIYAPSEIRESLVWHMTLANEKRIQANHAAKLEVLERPLAEVVAEVEQIISQATFASNPELARCYYRAARDTASTILRQVRPERGPLDYVQLCHIVHDSQCVLNRPDDALWHAKLACTVIDSLDPSEYRTERERLDYRAINSVRSEAIAYHNMGLFREALRLYARAETMDAMKQRGDFWKPHVFRDKIKSLAGLPRFSISEVENLADEVTVICEKRGDDYDPLLLLLNSEALARAYIQHGNYKDARRVLVMENDRIDKILHIGPLHRVLFMRTFARLCYVTQDILGWDYFISEAYSLAVESGLQHQINQIEGELQQGQSKALK